MELKGKQYLIFNGKGGVPLWLHSFACYIIHKYRNRYIVRVPIDDNRKRIVSDKNLAPKDPYEK